MKHDYDNYCIIEAVLSDPEAKLPWGEHRYLASIHIEGVDNDEKVEVGTMDQRPIGIDKWLPAEVNSVHPVCLVGDHALVLIRERPSVKVCEGESAGGGDSLADLPRMVEEAVQAALARMNGGGEAEGSNMAVEPVKAEDPSLDLSIADNELVIEHPGRQWLRAQITDIRGEGFQSAEVALEHTIDDGRTWFELTPADEFTGEGLTFAPIDIRGIPKSRLRVKTAAGGDARVWATMRAE